jgi:hypothetical protein
MLGQWLRFWTHDLSIVGTIHNTDYLACDLGQVTSIASSFDRDVKSRFLGPWGKQKIPINMYGNLLRKTENMSEDGITGPTWHITALI